MEIAQNCADHVITDYQNDLELSDIQGNLSFDGLQSIANTIEHAISRVIVKLDNLTFNLTLYENEFSLSLFVKSCISNSLDDDSKTYMGNQKGRQCCRTIEFINGVDLSIIDDVNGPHPILMTHSFKSKCSFMRTFDDVHKKYDLQSLAFETSIPIIFILCNINEILKILKIFLLNSRTNMNVCMESTNLNLKCDFIDESNFISIQKEVNNEVDLSFKIDFNQIYWFLYKSKTSIIDLNMLKTTMILIISIFIMIH